MLPLTLTMCCAVKPTALQHESGLLFGGCWRIRPTYHTYGRALSWLLDFLSQTGQRVLWCLPKKILCGNWLHWLRVWPVYPGMPLPALAYTRSASLQYILKVCYCSMVQLLLVSTLLVPRLLRRYTQNHGVLGVQSCDALLFCSVLHNTRP